MKSQLGGRISMPGYLMFARILRHRCQEDERAGFATERFLRADGARVIEDQSCLYSLNFHPKRISIA